MGDWSAKPGMRRVFSLCGGLAKACFLTRQPFTVSQPAALTSKATPVQFSARLSAVLSFAGRCQLTVTATNSSLLTHLWASNDGR